MRVKKYIVDSMPDALQKIRSDLGKDAVILNTKEIRIGGFLGLFSKKKIEVIAALDTQASTNKAKPILKQEIKTPIAQAQATAASVLAQISSVAVLEEPLPYVPDVILNHMPPIVVDKSVAKDDTVLTEIRQMKEMMSKLASRSQFTAVERHPILAALEEQLIAQEVSPLIIQQVLDRVDDELLSSGDELTASNVHAIAKNYLLHLIKTDASKYIAADTKVVHFVGPTGVGKTTTIAKIAAEQVLKHHRKVGFITSDTYRIAAVEQLKTYATILNIPLEVVFSPQDLNKAFAQLKDRDLIFMDTAGRNFRNEMYVSELHALLQGRGKSETFLVLSLTTKYKDMKVITDNFSKFNLDKVLFTKMDETDSYGSIVNLLNDFPLKLSYVTNGQNVPDDITVADEHAIISLIMGATSDE
ncbi:flagellar biosynthesis protein FlhF [Paenibacillus psychroresistens]|uniref:Flagellar biosynthesis protein FlhF n=1 Tax=Paenibacillus psychroresistens TaxID=1778678 RepID=A0A6B8RK97_9BACL|nr:flagellar biosynthesis protein FlhF [Paenibacillus psychroresistens]QGQ96247.1 flagellar biosynthesis protein FlhF [Paenibacillus psychroresistens]